MKMLKLICAIFMLMIFLIGQFVCVNMQEKMDLSLFFIALIQIIKYIDSIYLNDDDDE